MAAKTNASTNAYLFTGSVDAELDCVGALPLAEVEGDTTVVVFPGLKILT